jgi:hypothetical protein
MEEGTTDVSAQTTKDVVRTFEATVAILGAVINIVNNFYKQ